MLTQIGEKHTFGSIELSLEFASKKAKEGYKIDYLGNIGETVHVDIYKEIKK